MTTPTSRTLDRMIEILSPPEAWIREYLAGERVGSLHIPLDPREPRANCFCLLGARMRAGHEIGAPVGTGYGVRERLIMAIEHLFPDRLGTGQAARSVAIFNDHPDTTHADVLSILRLARKLSP